ncbi:P-loop NTPase [Anaeromicropila populeti]|uniref:MinD superfamily P-loop ATPase, contains an inserted ferredoxin domain n=1 Tax=Anaeromicropila populeti TaxID=37658 RepID=A0A1I6K5L3_9FIRM|nr:ATP-binding protein [Anaeromicropila populeti]SFR86496.1 MinD superfamily P-loop ATPase, contains an inserted ferredoxin domain [Anaeromicropila populeti]
MKIAVLSGKGGTGKTTVSTNLALTLNIPYIDCDVEEPNGFIFLNPVLENEEEVFLQVPEIHKETCTLCGACVKACQFHALAKAGKEIVLFEKLCHDCGACKLVCEADAVTFRKRAIGKIQRGRTEKIQCERGILNIGEPMAVPIIKKLLASLPEETQFIDCPPGTSCNVVNSLRFADAAILVTEPSEFGLHDMKMAIELVKKYSIPYGVIINKDDQTENMVKKYCKESQTPLLGAVPYSREAAIIYSKGGMLCQESSYKKIFEEIAEKMKEVFRWN